MKIKKNISISENGFLFNPETSDSFSVNNVAKDILKMLLQDKNIKEIKTALAESYEVNDLTLERDIYDLSRVLDQYSLLLSETE